MSIIRMSEMKFEIPAGLTFEYAKKLSKRFSDDDILQNFDVYFHHNGYRINVKDLIGILTLGIVEKSVVRVEIRRRAEPRATRRRARAAQSHPNQKFRGTETERIRLRPKLKSVGRSYVIKALKKIFKDNSKDGKAS